jgi:hypothetical protein
MDAAVQNAAIKAGVHAQRTIFTNPNVTVNLQGALAPFTKLVLGEPNAENPTLSASMVISDLRNDDRTVHAARETDKCHNCGKTGHWAKNCRIKRNFGSNNCITPKTEAFTFRGTAYKKTMDKMFKEVRKFAKANRKPFRAHFTNDVNDKGSQINSDTTSDKKGKPNPYSRAKERNINDNIAAFIINENINKFHQ